MQYVFVFFPCLAFSGGAAVKRQKNGYEWMKSVHFEKWGWGLKNVTLFRPTDRDITHCDIKYLFCFILFCFILYFALFYFILFCFILLYFLNFFSRLFFHCFIYYFFVLKSSFHFFRFSFLPWLFWSLINYCTFEPISV